MNDTDLKPEISWRAHPARERWGRTVGAIMVVGGMAATSGILMASPWWAIGAALGLVLALNRFFFASEFSIDDEGVTAKYPLRRQRLVWSSVRRFVCGDHDALLSPRIRPSAFDRRAIHLLFGDEGDRVRDSIKAHLSTGGEPWAC